MPKWDHLWDDFIQEETRREYLQGSSSNGYDEENVPRVGTSQRVKGKRTLAKSNALHVTSWGTMQVSVLIRRRSILQLQQKSRSFPLGSR